MAWALAGAILAFNVYRAATCSITIDEAFTYNRFVHPPFSRLLADYDANQHVLYTLLARATAGILGLSEFSLRLPAVLGGALYLWVALSLSRAVFGARPMLLPAFALLTLNPLVLEHMSMARGYGAGQACWMAAVYQTVSWPPSPSPRQMRLLGLLLAASAGFNLIFIPPALALLIWCAAGLRKQEGAWDRLLNHAVLPALVCSFLLLVLPLARAERGHFYLGEKTLWRSAVSIAEASLLQEMRWWATHMPGWEVAIWWIANLAPYAALTVLLLGVPAAIHTAFGTARSQSGRLGTALTTAGWATLIMLVAGHHAANVLYPFARTGIYWIPLLTLLGLWLVKNYSKYSLARGTGYALACAWVLLYGLQIRPAYYLSFPADAGSKDFVQALSKLRKGSGKIRLAVSWQLENGFLFYRHKDHLDWMEIERTDQLSKPADYYVLIPEDQQLAGRLNLRVILRHPVSRVLLAEPGSQANL